MGEAKFAAVRKRAADLWRLYAGRIVILGMCLIALLAALYAQWYLYFGSRRVLAYYGPDASTLIQSSKSIELLYLTPATPETKARRFPELNILDRPHAIEKVLDIAQAQGAIHARTALLSDANYIWNSDSGAGSSPGPAAGSTAWEYAFQFRQGKSTAIVAFAPSSGQAILVGNDTALSVAPIAQAMEDFRHGAEAQAAAGAERAAANRGVGQSP